jgi:hypothetical protein
MDEREQLGVSDWRQTGNWQGQGQAKKKDVMGGWRSTKGASAERQGSWKGMRMRWSPHTNQLRVWLRMARRSVQWAGGFAMSKRGTVLLQYHSPPARIR